MIKLKIGNAGHETDIRFPISESDLYDRLFEILAIDSPDQQPPVTVTGVYWPEEFSVLEGRQVNLDEMNYLAKRMESFDALEMDQFLIGISKLDDPSPKDLINLTFNLDHFTLARDVSNYGKIGRAYVMNTEGAVPANDEDNPKYTAIGKDLIDRGLAQITAKGLLIYNPFDKLNEVYDGHTFPPYYDRSDFVAAATLEYNGRQELLLLPEEELAIGKAVARLGASSIQACAIHMDASPLVAEPMAGRIEALLNSEGIYEVNAMLGKLSSENMDWEKLAAVAELADARKASQVAALAERLEDFDFIPKVSDEEDIAHYLVDNVDGYSMHPDMEDFFDFSAFGEQFAEEHGGQFVNGGFAYYSGYGSMDELLEDLTSEDEGMTMGGM